MELVLREAMTALGCLISSPCVVLSLSLETHPHTPMCLYPSPTFSMGQLETFLYGDPDQFFVCCLLCVGLSLCTPICSQDAEWGDRDAGEAIERSDNDSSNIFVLIKIKKR